MFDAMNTIGGEIVAEKDMTEKTLEAFNDV